MRVIAEVGSNWKSFDDCSRSIAAASRAKADVVKFQLFTAEELYGAPYDGLKGVLPRDWVPHLASIAHDCGIEFMCTAFSPDGYRFIDPFVKCHKVASAELTAIDILKTVNDLKKPVCLSTGGATTEEINTALAILTDVPVTLFYCVADYPAKVVDFRAFDQLRIRHDAHKYGYSDHSIDVLNIPELAQAMGASVIEKHVNFTEHTDTPDAPHAINEAELALMIKNLKGEATMADTDKLCNVQMKTQWKRRAVYSDDGSIGYFRPLPK